MIKHLEIKSYVYGDVKVMVEINYDTKKISLVEKSHEFLKSDFRTIPKKYIFVQRELSYMNGWRNVLTAIRYAIDQAEKDLKSYIKYFEEEKLNEVTDVLIKASGLKLSSIKKKK